MAETMTGGRTMTFAELEKDLNSRAEQPAQPPAEAAATPPAEIPASSVELPANAEPPVEVDNTVVQFDLSLGGEKEPTQPAAQPQQPTYNWKEELKKISKDEVIAELGFDPFSVEMDKHIKGGGQPLDYLNARAIDYSKISDDALIKDDLRKQYPTLSPQQIDLMFNKRYNVSITAEEDEKELAQINLQGDAYKIRQNRIAEQQRFKISDTLIPQKDEAYEQWKQNTDLQAQRNQMMNDFYTNHPATKSLNESKKVTLNFGEGVAPFNFVIDKPEMLTKPFVDDGSIWNKLTSTPQGEPDVAKQHLIALFSYNPQKFIQDVFKYGKSMGVQKELVDEGRNAQKPQAIGAGMKNESNKAIPTGVSTFAKSASR